MSTLGTKRFRVLRRSEKDGYDTANIEFIKDEPICEDNYSSIMDLHYRVMEKAKQWCENLPDNIKAEILKSFGQMPDLEEDWEISHDGPSWTWWIIAILPLSPLLKVYLYSRTGSFQFKTNSICFLGEYSCNYEFREAFKSDRQNAN